MAMNYASLIEQYGYFALFAGALLEGETMLVLAGLAAFRGYLELHWVILIAFFGGFLGDQAYFWLGRKHGAWVLSQFPRLRPVFERSDLLIARYHELLIVGIRFLYGFRTVGPMALGMSSVLAWRFMLLNALGAAIWAVGIGGAGYLFGNALTLFFHDFKRIEEALLAVMLLLGFVVWGIRRYQFKKKFK